MVSTMTMTTALKEWAVAIKTLDEGRQVVIVRKGGIHEKRFGVEREAFLLFPTYEHQRSDLIKPTFQADLESVLATAPTSGFTVIRNWARVAATFETSDDRTLEAIADHHIWTDRYASERLHWRPRQPLRVLVLRVYRLAREVTIPVVEAYGGCRSWLELEQAIPIGDSAPVLSEEAFQARLDAIRTVFG